MVGFTLGPATLSARPPTPPRESTRQLGIGNDAGPITGKVSRSLLDTPDESPSSSVEYFRNSSEKAQKKIRFSPWTEFHRLPEADVKAGGRGSDSESSVRRLPPSKDCKSFKSILKACADNPMIQSSNELLAFDDTSLPAMLRSATHHLASLTRTARLDSYTALLTCLGTYDDVPEMQDSSEDVVKISIYMRRDVTARLESDGTLDMQLTTQALKVLTVFLGTPTLAILLPEDFCTFILDRALSSIEDVSSPKIIVIHYMHLLEKQKFPPKQMTTDRMNRLVSALNLVPTRIKGNRVLCHRLMIYRRLLIQAQSLMAARVGSWIDPLISGMLSSIKDNRVRALGFGLEASLRLGTIMSVSQACIESFNRVSEEGKKVVEFLSSRLVEMMSSKEDAMHVPQIWSVVILFLRSRRRQLECWEHIKAWLAIIQRCLNSSEPQVKFQANIAWSRLIFTVNIDDSTSDSMARMLRQPLISQLEPKASDKNSKQTKQIARSTYCTLLYYAFCPGARYTQLDQYWDLYVSQILPSSFAASKSDTNHACNILVALFSSNGKPRIWDDNRANTNGLVKTNELPCLDPKWTRSRAARIIHTFESLFDLANWHFGKGQQSPVLLAWRSFMSALGAASSKEVKVSMDAMIAISQIINLCKRVLDKCNELYGERTSQQHILAQADPVSPFESFTSLIEPAVASMGTIPFMERRVILTSQDSFEAAETPSSRSKHNSGSLDTPLMHLMKLLVRYKIGERQTTSYVDALNAIIQICLQPATSRRTNLAALRNLTHLLTTEDHVDKEASLILWQLFAKAAFSSFKLPQHTDPHNATPQHSGQEYRDGVRILELGVRQRSVDIISAWRELHDCITASLRKEIGDSGIPFAMTEPLADAMGKDCGCCDDTLVSIATTLVETTHWPQSAQVMERAHKLLWGSVRITHKAVSVCQFDKLYSMIDELLCGAYRSLKTLSEDITIRFLSALTALVRSCPSVHRESIISRVQHGFGVWVEDVDEAWSSSHSSENAGISHAVHKLWETIATTIEQFSEYSTRLLFNIQHILRSGLSSRRRSFLNRCIMLWNQTFGCAQALEYPEDLRKILQRLRSMTDIQLPTFPEADDDEGGLSSDCFPDSQDFEAGAQRLPIPTLPCRREPESTLHLKDKGPKTSTISSSLDLATSNASQSEQRRVKITPKARLRHDNSQIHFAAIDSSPIEPGLVNSQNLTTHQKEVKERQDLEAAMFREIRSSPKSVSRHPGYGLPRLNFDSRQGQALIPALDEQISPVYPSDVLMSDFLGSSPTPGSSKKGANDMHPNDGPPSSPPAILSDLDNHQQRISNERDSELAEIYHRTPDDAKSPSNIEINPDRNAEHDAVSKNVIATNIHNESSMLVEIVRQPDDRKMSDPEPFVDALPNPTEEFPASERDVTTTTVFDSFHNDNPSSFRSEDDQVTAQLISEMERASSQNVSNHNEADKPISKSGLKRKRTVAGSENSHKKARHSPDSWHRQAISETPKAGESVVECVLIKVNPVMSKNGRGVQHIKRERSQSPSLIASTPFENTTPEIGNRHGRLSGSFWANQRRRAASFVTGGLRPSLENFETITSDENRTHSPQRKSARLSGISASSPPQPASSLPETASLDPRSVTKRGKRKASRRWFWVADQALDDEDGSGGTTGVAPSEVDAKKAVRNDQTPGSMESEYSQQLPGDQKAKGQALGDLEGQGSAANDRNEAVPADMADALASHDPPTSEGILQGFRRMLEHVKRVAMGREEERQMIGVLFETVKEVHEAGRRNTEM